MKSSLFYNFIKVVSTVYFFKAYMKTPYLAETNIYSAITVKGYCFSWFLKTCEFTVAHDLATPGRRFVNRGECIKKHCKCLRCRSSCYWHLEMKNMRRLHAPHQYSAASWINISSSISHSPLSYLQALLAGTVNKPLNMASTSETKRW